MHVASLSKGDMTVTVKHDEQNRTPVEDLIAHNRQVIASARKKRKGQKAAAEKAQKTLSSVSRTLRHAS